MVSKAAAGLLRESGGQSNNESRASRVGRGSGRRLDRFPRRLCSHIHKNVGERCRVPGFSASDGVATGFNPRAPAKKRIQATGRPETPSFPLPWSNAEREGSGEGRSHQENSDGNPDQSRATRQAATKHRHPT